MLGLRCMCTSLKGNQAASCTVVHAAAVGAGAPATGFAPPGAPCRWFQGFEDSVQPALCCGRLVAVPDLSRDTRYRCARRHHIIFKFRQAHVTTA